MLEKKGLVKLTEECGELIQVAAKKQTCMETDEHWDKAGSLKERLENEIGDVMAASEIVIKNFGLDRERIIQRSNEKFQVFEEWMNEDEKPKDNHISQFFGGIEIVTPRFYRDNEICGWCGREVGQPHKSYCRQ